MNFVSQKYDTIPVPIIQGNLGTSAFSLSFWCAILFESELSIREAAADGRIKSQENRGQERRTEIQIPSGVGHPSEKDR